MKKKKLVTSGNMTRTLILNYICWGILFGIISTFVVNIVSVIMLQLITTDNIIGGYVLLTIVVSAIYILFNYITIRNSISSSFKNKGIQKDDVHKVLKNIIIVLIVYIICFSIPSIISIIGDFNESIESYEETIDSINSFYSLYGSEASEKIADLEKLIEDTKIATYVSIVIEVIMIVFSEFAMYFVYKKYMMKELEKQLETDFED